MSDNAVYTPSERLPLSSVERFERAKWLVETFKLERYVYVGLSVAAVCILLVMGVLQFAREGGWESFLVILGPTGVLTGVLTRMFWVWNRTAELLFGAEDKR